jgi:hypothetical protein
MRDQHPQRALLLAPLFGFALLQTGCDACSQGSPNPMARQDLVGSWVAPEYSALRRLVLTSDGTGELSTVLLQEIGGRPRKTSYPATVVRFDEVKGTVVITAVLPDDPGKTVELRLRGPKGADTLFGSELLSWGGEYEMRFLRESVLRDALDRASVPASASSR